MAHRLIFQGQDKLIVVRSILLLSKHVLQIEFVLVEHRFEITEAHKPLH
jgi:hypothetical protein